MNRLTTEDAVSLMKKHDVKLIHYSYGFNDKHPRSGCALSMLMLRHTDSRDMVRNIMDDTTSDLGFLERISVTTDQPIEYLLGLEHGFEAPTAHRSRYAKDSGASPEGIAGYEDGVALRSLAH